MASTRDISTQLEMHLGGAQQTLCYLWLVEPEGYAAEGYTSFDDDLSYDPGPRAGAPSGEAVTFRSAGGTAPSEIPASIGLSVDSTDVRAVFGSGNQSNQVLFGLGAITRAKIMTGHYRSARVTIYLVNWDDLSQGHVILTAGKLGKADITESGVIFELLTWSQLLSRSPGRVTNTVCQWPFMRSHCRNNTDGFDEEDPLAPDDGPKPSDSGRTLSGVLASVPSTSHVQVSGVVAADGFANFGRLRVTSGAYAGAEFEIKKWSSSGDAWLSVASPFLLEEGCAVEIEEGCEHTFDACKAKENTKNFGGQPYLPPEERLQKTKKKDNG